ncbi:MAG TPA: hypothetical protein VE170_01615, partial [Candidatus Limnocylindria bacterium]|nr:hypothetical protein [Candidatus Limnocylindria bacterium]
SFVFVLFSFGQNSQPLLTMLARVLFLIGVTLLDYRAAAGESVALYSASFDPPTRSQLRMLRCVLGDAELPQECREPAAQISRLIIWVDAAPNVEAHASAKERVLMLNRSLQAHRPRLEISAHAPSAIEEKRRALLADETIDKIFLLIDGDTNRRPSSTQPRSPKLVQLLFPLVHEARLSADLAAFDRKVDPQAAAIIDQLGLYREVSGDLAELQRELFDEGWRAYLSDLVIACPLAIDRNTCTSLAASWRGIPTVANPPRNISAGESSLAQLAYAGTQSESRWAEKFTETSMTAVREPADRDRLKAVAEDLAERTLRDLPRGKLPHLHRLVTPRRAAKTKGLRVSRSPVTCAAPNESYSADMDRYLADRFPQAFSRFLKHDYRRYSDQAVELYLHDHPLEQAYDLHRRDGFSDFYFVQTRRGQLHRDISSRGESTAARLPRCSHQCARQGPARKCPLPAQPHGYLRHAPLGSSITAATSVRAQ